MVFRDFQGSFGARHDSFRVNFRVSLTTSGIDVNMGRVSIRPLLSLPQNVCLCKVRILENTHSNTGTDTAVLDFLEDYSTTVVGIRSPVVRILIGLAPPG